jgi:hypothetical protein
MTNTTFYHSSALRIADDRQEPIHDFVTNRSHQRWAREDRRAFRRHRRLANRLAREAE